jgi:UDP-glucuronate decarboxylase
MHSCGLRIADGLEALCIDNLFTGGRRNIQHLLTNPNFAFIWYDVCFPLYVEVDAIYSLACPHLRSITRTTPIQTTKTSVLGSINIGNPKEMLVGQLAELVVIEMTGARVEIEHRDLPDEDPKVRRSDIGTARSILAVSLGSRWRMG